MFLLAFIYEKVEKGGDYFYYVSTKRRYEKKSHAFKRYFLMYFFACYYLSYNLFLVKTFLKKNYL